MTLKRNKITYLLLFIFIAISISLFFKCKYGYATLDEGFYPTIAYRFIKGDKILYEEWNNSQLCALLIMPFIKAYLLINKSTDGIYLFIRYSYTVLKIIMSIIIYLRLRKYHKLGAYITSLIFLVYSGYGLMVLSYNSFSVGGAILFTLFLLNDNDDKKAKVSWIISGLGLSISVLAIPYNALLYVLYVLAVVVISKISKSKDINPTIKNVYSYKALLYVSIGVGIAIILFTMYVLSSTSISEIIETIPYIIKGDPAHPVKTLYGFTLAYLVRILTISHNYYVFGVYALMGIALLISFFKKEKSIFIYSEIVLSIILIMVYIITENYVNHIVFVPNVLALLLNIIYKDEKTNILFSCICIPGLVVSYLEHIASNTGFTGISNASLVSTIGSILILVILISKNIDNKLFTRLVYSFILLIFISLSYYRITYVFWEDGGLPSLTYRIDEGPCAGLLTSESYYETYTSQMRDAKDILSLDEETNVLLIGDQTLWMASNQRCATYSPLNYSIGSTDLLFDYYKIHKDKIADIVYISNDYKEELKDKIKTTYNYKEEIVESGWILSK